MLTLRRAEGAKSKTSCLSNYRFGPFRLNASTPVAPNRTLGFAFLQSTQLGFRPHDNITNWFELIFLLLISLTKMELVGAFYYGIEIRQACSPLIQLFFGFASDIDQTNINLDNNRDGNWLSS